MKRYAILFTLLLCLCLTTARAQVSARQTDAAISSGGTCITTFDTELPDDLATVLETHGYVAKSLCGVDWHSSSRFAWVVQEQENDRNVIALNKWTSKEWQVASLGTKILPAEGSFTLDCDGWSAAILLQVPLQEGGWESFLFEPSGNMTKVFWRLQEYQASYSDGSYVRIFNEDYPSAQESMQYSYVFELSDANGSVHQADYRWLTDGLTDSFDYTAFPRTERQFIEKSRVN